MAVVGGVDGWEALGKAVSAETEPRSVAEPNVTLQIAKSDTTGWRVRNSSEPYGGGQMKKDSIVSMSSWTVIFCCCVGLEGILLRAM